MYQLRWDENFATSNRALDAANESLFFLLRHLFNKGVECSGRVCVAEPTCRKVDALITFLSRNFAAEEAMMEECGYPARAPHAEDHAQVLARLSEWRRTCICQPDAHFDVSSFVGSWARRHVATLDRGLGAWIRQNDPDPAEAGEGPLPFRAANS